MWLPLAEYSLKNKVSISTLRRKIKASDIEYRLDDGKYLILDSEVTSSKEADRPSLSRDMVSAESLAAEPKSVLTTATESGESVITAANRLLADLKKAYTQVLQDKEVQILNLKEDISDLKTLIKVLESENDRLRNQ
jgi:hypothetical protein